MTSPYSFTVFTPSYNRAHTLGRVYESLQKQTWRDFEWLVVDDGSSDNTAELVQGWAKDADFPIRYLRKENGGKHTAHNLAVTEARGQLFAILDSDDWFTQDALTRFYHHWESIPQTERQNFAGLGALFAAPDGSLIGSNFPAEVFDADDLSIRLKHRVTGDKCGVYRTEVLRQFLFPVVPGERFVTEALVWNRIAMRYKIRFINEVLSIKDYQNEGLSEASARVRAQNPQAACLYYQEFVNRDYPLPVRVRLRNYANYIRYSLHLKQPNRAAAGKINSLIWYYLSWPLGYWLWQRDCKQGYSLERAAVEKR